MSKNTSSEVLKTISILEIGSYDVSGSIRNLFSPQEYIGVDLTEGPSVDLVCSGHEIDFLPASFDVAISCECFEHNPHWKLTIQKMYHVLKHRGILCITCGGRGRPEHGTLRTSSSLFHASPASSYIGWNYYNNLFFHDFLTVFDLSKDFSDYRFYRIPSSQDLYFIAIKQAPPLFQAKWKISAVRVSMPDFDKSTLQIKQNPHYNRRYSSSIKEFLFRLYTFPPYIASLLLNDILFQGFRYKYFNHMSRYANLLRRIIK